MRHSTTVIILLLLLSSGAVARGTHGTHALRRPWPSNTPSPRNSTPEGVRTSDRHRNNQQVERIAAADPRVTVSACVVAGSLTVRSWDRKEVRARISDGTQFELTRTDQTKSQLATELKLTLKGNHRVRKGAQCLPLGEIELDVPQGASLDLQTSSGAIRATGVARVTAYSTAGSIVLAKVNKQIDADTIGGEVLVSDSTGSIKLHSTGGSVQARNLAPADASDTLEAGTIGGEITLDRIKHRQVKVKTVSGQVEYVGPLSRGGIYRFQSISGQLRLSLPADSSFRFSGTVGESGDFSSDFKLNTPPRRGLTRNVDGTVGSGDALVEVSVFSGSVRIRKL